MKALGIYGDKGALLSKEKGKIAIEWVGPLSGLETPQQEVVRVTGLPASSVIRRHFLADFTDEKKVLATLPFQVEPLIPFPIDQAIIIPFLYPQGDKTEVVFFATQKVAVEKHLEQFPSDKVSTVAAALARWGCHFFPDLPLWYLIHEGLAIVVREGRLVASLTLEGGEMDLERLEAFVQAKFPEAERILEIDSLAIPVGLALDVLYEDGKELSFLQGPLVPATEKEKRRKGRVRYALATLTLALVSWCLGTLLVYREERAVHALLTRHGIEEGALEERLDRWERVLKQENPLAILEQEPVSLREALAWISSLKENFSITSLEYKIESPLTLENKKGANLVKMELELPSLEPEVAKNLHAFFQGGGGGMIKKQKVSWEAKPSGYHVAFILVSVPVNSRDLASVKARGIELSGEGVVLTNTTPSPDNLNRAALTRPNIANLLEQTRETKP